MNYPHHRDDRRQPPGFLERFRGSAKRQPPPQMRDETERLLNEAAPRIAAAHPIRHQPRSFTDQFQEFTGQADKLAQEHNELIDKHRLALTENEMLRQRVVDYEDYVEKMRVYWEEQVTRLTNEKQTYVRLYHALDSRLDAVVEAVNATRTASKRAAFAADPTIEPREDVYGVRPRYEVDQQDVAELEALLGGAPRQPEATPLPDGPEYGEPHTEATTPAAPFPHRRADLDMPPER